MKNNDNKITTRSLILGVIFSAIFAAITVYFENRRGIIITASQIPVAPYFLLILTVVLLNPLCSLLRFIRRFTIAEILIIFIMGMVSSGLASFGLASQLVPVVGSFFNSYWNNDQSEWNRYITPYVKEGYFLSEPGIQQAARDYYQAEAELNRIKIDQPQNTAQYQQILAQKHTALDELEQKAFAKVDLFRRGLPDKMRAFPGFIPLPEEGIHIYLARVRRFSHGLSAAGDLRHTQKLIAEAPDGTIPAAGVTEKITTAIESLELISDPQDIMDRKEALSAKWQRLNEKSVQIDQGITAFNQERADAPSGELKRLDKKINRLTRDARNINKDKKNAAESIRRTDLELRATATVAQVVSGLTELKGRIDNGTMPGDLVTARIEELLGTFHSFDASLSRFIIGDVPWSDWLAPLARWALVIGLTYLILMTFNLLIFRQWAHNERLVYPLAQLPEILVGADSGDSNHAWPPIFRSGLFWIGVLVPATILGWNILVGSQLVPGLTSIVLSKLWTPYVLNTAFEAWSVHIKSVVFFTMIGLTFLIPTEISFSLWFFSVGHLVQLLVLVWLGYGLNDSSFPMEFIYTLNFRSAEGAGALVIFAVVVLYKCRKYILCGFKPSCVADLETAERRELKISSILFVFGSMALILVLWQGMGANLAYTIFFYFVIMVITVGLIRAVAEGGILAFQAYSGPFHFIRTLFGMDKAWTSATLFAPLTVYYSVLFLDIKTFIAPAMANCIKIRDDLGMKRLRFHFAIFIAIAIAGVVSIAVHLIMTYDKGADSMNSWFYVAFPRHLFIQMTDMTKIMPVDETSNHLWIGVGAALMALLLVGRRSIFWLPHPIGLIMLVNPIMYAYWFSILIGWLAKKLVTKYGNKDTYEHARYFFIGLIAGEITMVLVAMIVAQITGLNITIDLNRNAW